MEKKYVIQSINDQGKVKFYSIDRNFSGSTYWDIMISNAEMFSTIDEAVNVIQGADFTSDIEVRDKNSHNSYELFPPRLVNSAIELSTEKRSGFMDIHICEIELNTVIEKRVYGERKIYNE